ncbi:MAG: DUF883 C-terminal domain-containing protein [Balneolaceae bacterium]
MSDHQKSNIEEIQVRKERLKNELEIIEKKYAAKIGGVKSAVDGSLKPAQTIRRNPLKAVGYAVLVGFTVGLLKNSRSSKQKKHKNDHSGESRIGLTSLLVDELKRLAARKAMVFVSDIVDNEVIPRIKSSDKINKPSSNDQ